jgi:hypothetical protein
VPVPIEISHAHAEGGRTALRSGDRASKRPLRFRKTVVASVEAVSSRIFSAGLQSHRSRWRGSTRCVSGNVRQALVSLKPTRRS